MAHYFAAEIPAELAAEVEETIERIREAPSPTEHRDEGLEMVSRLTEVCLERYFLHSVRAMGVGALAEKATAMGLKAAHRAIGVFLRRIAGGLSAEQMLTLADLVEGMLFEDATEPG